MTQTATKTAAPMNSNEWKVPHVDDDENGIRFFEARVCYCIAPSYGYFSTSTTPKGAFDMLVKLVNGGERSKKELLKIAHVVVLPPGITHHGFNGFGVSWRGGDPRAKAVILQWEGGAWVEKDL